MSKEEEIDKARKSNIFPEEYLDSYEEDLKDSNINHEKKKNEELDNKLLSAFKQKDRLLEELILLRRT